MVSVYEVRLRGAASLRVIESLCSELDMEADTVLVCEVQDQAALHGLLARIRDVGLELLEFHQVTPPTR